jgi:hypothetical protein
MKIPETLVRHCRLPTLAAIHNSQSNAPFWLDSLKRSSGKKMRAYLESTHLFVAGIERRCRTSIAVAVADASGSRFNFALASEQVFAVHDCFSGIASRSFIAHSLQHTSAM